MPFCHLRIKTLRCPYPHGWKCTQTVCTEPKTFGEHIRKRRLELHLPQQAVANKLHVHVESVKNWERDVGAPAIHQIPRIIKFLGYDPESEPETLPKRIAYARCRLGFTQEDLAKGTHRANYTRRVAGDRPWALKPEHEWILTRVEPLVSEDLWQKCNDMLEARKTELARPAKRAVHLFAGLTSCECGKKMYVPSNSPKYVCTACRNKIPIVDLEGIFLDELKNYLVSPEQVAAYLQSANTTIGEKNGLLESLRNELQKVKQQAEQTYQLYLQGGLTVEQFKEIYQPVDARKRQIEDEVPRVEAEVDILKIDGLSSEHIIAEARDLHSRWPKMTRDERRRIIELLVKNVVICRGEITLNLCYLPSFEKMTIGQRTL